MTSPARRWAGLAGTVLATLAAAAGTAVFLWFGDYIPAVFGALSTLAGAWFVYAELVATTPADHEREVVRILTGLGGRSTEAEFEAALEAEADAFGIYSGEALDDWGDAIERLQAAGRLRIDGGLVVLMPAAGQ